MREFSVFRGVVWCNSDDSLVPLMGRKSGGKVHVCRKEYVIDFTKALTHNRHCFHCAPSVNRHEHAVVSKAKHESDINEAPAWGRVTIAGSASGPAHSSDHLELVEGCNTPETFVSPPTEGLHTSHLWSEVSAHQLDVRHGNNAVSGCFSKQSDRPLQQMVQSITVAEVARASQVGPRLK